MLIGLFGYKGSGKDTVAKYLVANHNFIQLSFANALKENLSTLFNVPLDYWEYDKEFPQELLLGVSKRYVLQNQSECLKKEYGDEYFVNIVKDQILDIYSKYNLDTEEKNIVVSDIRFPNEFDMIDFLGGNFLYILRNIPFTDTHESESYYGEFAVRNNVTTIFNTSSKEALYDMVNSYLMAYK